MNASRRILGGTAVITAVLLTLSGCGPAAQPTGSTSIGAGSRSAGSSSASSSAPSPVPNQATFAQAMAEPVQSWRTSFRTGSMTFAVPGAVVGASVGDGPIGLVANGDAVLGSRPMQAQDAFHIGSMTKLVTAALIMQLDQEEILSLDDTLNRWFPAAPNASKITVKMLLEHESGLHELDFSLVGKVTSQQLVDKSSRRRRSPCPAPSSCT